ncbi:MAG TPA: N-acetylmuramoyl-L-alanine amidase, partial [Chloroflexota bacterium]|nr:N-acetylmuramoyl-L-alanine amidase [Chloroflexota bacterium]
MHQRRRSWRLLVVAALSAALLLAAGAGSPSGPAGAQGQSPTPTPALAPFFASQTRAPGVSAFFLTQTAVAPRGPQVTPPAPSPTASPSRAPLTATPLRSPTPVSSPTPRAPPFQVQPGALAGRTVVIDPGHGGRDPGAAHHGVREADVNLAVALLVRPLLEGAGARVVLTRETDRALASGGVDADLQARVNVAQQAQADLFVSIHANAHTDREVQGAISFYGPEAGFNSGARRTPRLVARSRQLATALNREVALAAGQPDRGTRAATFWVLGGPRAPAVLVEIGFLTNAEEAALLATPAHQRYIAQGVAAGIGRYLAFEEDAQFVADVTLDDGAVLTPGQAALKTWRVRNTGATTWGPNHRLAFHSGDPVGGPLSVPLAGMLVPPGSEAEVSVPLRAAPEQAGRSLRGLWQLQAPDGGLFGDRLWVSLRTDPLAPLLPPLPDGPLPLPAPALPPLAPPLPTPTPLPLPTDRVAPVPHPDVVYVEATGHNLGFAFRRFYDAYGGLDLFGYPRTEELQEGGFTVQYFQRARFEHHLDRAGTPYEVQLTLLGDALTADRRPFPGVAPFPAAAERVYVAETGHGLAHGFLAYWRARGGLDAFGHPVSEERDEPNGDGSGRAYTVQHFQRARFEYHPEHAGTPYEVQLGLLGDEALR